MSTSKNPGTGSANADEPAAAGRRRYHHGDLRNTLLDVARRMSHEVGPDALTLRAVARETGVSHAAAYNHFIDKNDLLRALAIQAFDDLGAALQQAIAETDAGIEELGVVYMRFAFGNPVEFRFMFRRELCMPDGMPDPLEIASRRAQHTLRAHLQTLQREGRIVTKDLDDLLLTTWSQMHGVTTILLETPAFKTVTLPQAEEHTRRCMRGLLHGVEAKAGDTNG